MPARDFCLKARTKSLSGAIAVTIDVNRNEPAVARSAGLVCFPAPLLGAYTPGFMLTPASRVRLFPGLAIPLLTAPDSIYRTGSPEGLIPTFKSSTAADSFHVTFRVFARNLCGNQDDGD